MMFLVGHGKPRQAFTAVPSCQRTECIWLEADNPYWNCWKEAQNAHISRISASCQYLEHQSAFWVPGVDFEYFAAGIPHPSDFDPTNTTIFIGGLSPGINEEDLRNVFGRFGEIIYTKVPANKGCGFCQFVERPAAETAMQQLQGQVCSWLASVGAEAPYECQQSCVALKRVGIGEGQRCKDVYNQARDRLPGCFVRQILTWHLHHA